MRPHPMWHSLSDPKFIYSRIKPAVTLQERIGGTLVTSRTTLTVRSAWSEVLEVLAQICLLCSAGARYMAG